MDRVSALRAAIVKVRNASPMWVSEMVFDADLGRQKAFRSQQSGKSAMCAPLWGVGGRWRREESGLCFAVWERAVKDAYGMTSPVVDATEAVIVSDANRFLATDADAWLWAGCRIRARWANAQVRKLMNLARDAA